MEKDLIHLSWTESFGALLMLDSCLLFDCFCSPSLAGSFLHHSQLQASLQRVSPLWMLLKIWLLHESEAINLTAGGIISCECGNQNHTGLCFQMFPESCGKDLGPDCGSEWGQPRGKAWGAQEAEITDLRCYMCNCNHVLRWQSFVKKNAWLFWILTGQWLVLKLTQKRLTFLSRAYLQISEGLMHSNFVPGYQTVVPISLATYTAGFPNILLREYSLSLSYHEEF